MMTMNNPLAAFAILISFMYFGDVISKKTKAYIPAILVFVLLILAGAWSNIIPKTIIEIPGFTAYWASYIIAMYLVDMGTSISLKQLKEQWKTVLISLAAIIVPGVLIMTIGSMLFGLDIAKVAAPTVTGGFIAVITLSNAAIAIGKDFLGAFVVLIFVVHSFPAYILFPNFVKKEGRRILTKSMDNKDFKKTSASSEGEKNGLIAKIPDTYKTGNFYLFNVVIFAVLANFLAGLTNNLIPANIIGLLFGIFGFHFGLIEKNPIRKSNSSGYLMFGSMISIFTILAQSDPAEILASLPILLGLIILGVLGLLLGSILVGKILGFTKEMSGAIGLNSLLGFPLNFMMTTEAINAIASTEEEKDYLTNNLLPSMLIAGFVSITVGSTIFASIMVNYL